MGHCNWCSYSSMASTWLSNAECILLVSQKHLAWLHITVSDLLLQNSKQWNTCLINALFVTTTSLHIHNTPLAASVQQNTSTWKFEKNGRYLVRCAYQDIMQHINDAIQHRVARDCNIIWNLKYAPKVKNFLWRACRSCIPTRLRLQSKGV